MGFLNALIQSASRFNESLLPTGYAERNIMWVCNIPTLEGSQPIITKKRKGELVLRSPATLADRASSKVSPVLLVDKISYAIGMPDSEKSKKEHESYMELLQQCVKDTNNEQVKMVLDFLKRCSPFIPEGKENSLLAFQIEGRPWPTDNEQVKQFWSEYVEKRLSEDVQQCVICGQTKPIIRILPFKATLMKGTDSVQLASFNLGAFQSLGKTMIKERTKRIAGANAAICYACASTAVQALMHLVTLELDNYGKEKSSGRHAVVLARDARQSLGNQIAVFWTKEQIEIKADDGANRSFEDIAKAPIEDFDDIPEDAAPVQAGQCKKIIGMPFFGGQGAPVLPTNRFYLAVLSPNKSRLVVREWLETDIAPVQENIARYIEALEIIHPDGRGVWWPPLQTLLKALCSYTSAKKEYDEKPRLQIGPDVTRKLIRCIYTGTPPPEALLAQAVRCFRVPDPPTEDRKQRERQMLRRMAMAAAMKLVLTYQNEKEAKAMVELKPKDKPDSKYKEEAPYNCGVLLAILEETQRRASSSGRGVNATLVDRFYGAASTAPVTVFSNLISMATKAHLPKLRRENKEFFKVRSQAESININDLIEEACRAINAAGGFPAVLKMSEQAEFALGFYHQRAEFNTPRTPASNKGPNNTKQGGQS